MNQEFIEKLKYSYSDSDDDDYPLPISLRDTLRIVFQFFENASSNKLCVIFPSKEYAAQWLSIPLTLENINHDFKIHQEEIYKSFENYKPGDKLILNQSSIVEWAHKTSNKITFKTGCNTYFSLGLSGAFKLQPAPRTRHKLSSLKRVKQDLPKRKKSPIDKLLGIDSYGNKLFQKSSICLISKYKDFEQSVENVLLNRFGINEYFRAERINENGNISEFSPLLIANNYSNLSQYLSEPKPVSKIIIDGFNLVSPRADFIDVDRQFSIPTILLTDLAEIEFLQDIKNHGFEFFAFSKGKLRIDPIGKHSSFHTFNKRLRKFNEFSIKKEVCNCPVIEDLISTLYSIETDDSNRELNLIRMSIFQLTNKISRIAYIPSEEELKGLAIKINNVDTSFQKHRIWLGDSEQPIKECIALLQSLINIISAKPTEKCNILEKLVGSGSYDYIICHSEEEKRALKDYIISTNKHDYPELLVVGEVNDNIISNDSLSAILLGWPKGSNMNRIVHSFLFTELTLLFYKFENKYHSSLQMRNRKYLENIDITIDMDGAKLKNNSLNSPGFEDVYFDVGPDEDNSVSSFNIIDFELKLDSIQYSGYQVKGNLADSIRAKRIDFGNDQFLYSTESHKLLIINEFFEQSGNKAKLQRRKIESIRIGDIIAFIHTERDILVALVERNTNPDDLASLKQWTELWRDLLKDYYSRIGNDFSKLVKDLREFGCSKHEATIRSWLQDESRIGPDDNADLVSIAKIAKSEHLFNNIDTVRESIRKMTGLRMKASDFISNKIKSQMHKYADSSMINEQISIEGLGSVEILRVVNICKVWENIDIRYVNRLLEKENI